MSESPAGKSNKICYIVTIPLTIEAFFIPQLKYLAENGFDVSVICSPSETLQEQLGDRVHYIPVTIPRGLSAMGMLRAIGTLYRIFRQNRFDLIQYSTPNAALCGAIAGVLAGVKIRNYHLMGLRYLGAGKIGRPLLKLLEKITCMLSTSIECVSKSNRELGIQEGLFSEEKSTVVWNGSSGGVDLKRFDFSKRQLWRKEIRKKLNYEENDFVFGFVGRITRDKGINEILEAFSRLKSGKLLFVGNEEGVETLDQKLLKEARENPNITFHGSVTDVEKYFAAIDVLLLPSYREGFGNVVIEAAAMGTPAIVSNIPGPIDAIEQGKTGITVPTRDAESLVNTMAGCLNDNPLDSFYCAQFAADHFDSVRLSKEIYMRKKSMLEVC